MTLLLGYGQCSVIFSGLALALLVRNILFEILMKA